MEEGRTDTVGDEGVQARNEGFTMGAATDTEASDLVWDPQDLLFEFNDENSDVTQTPVAALTPLAVLTQDEMLDLEDADPEGPPQGNPP